MRRNAKWLDYEERLQRFNELQATFDDGSPDEMRDALIDELRDILSNDAHHQVLAGEDNRTDAEPVLGLTLRGSSRVVDRLASLIEARESDHNTCPFTNGFRVGEARCFRAASYEYDPEEGTIVLVDIHT